MLILTDRRPGDRLLSKEEALLKSFQETDQAVQKYRLHEQDDFKNAEKRLGQQMSHNELIRRVTKLNPRIWAEDSRNFPDTVCGFYTVKDGEKAFICAFDKGYLPEFSIVFTDTADLPVKEKRGWRTVLLRLLGFGALTWAQILEVFGDAHGMNSKYWRLNTQEYR